MPKFYCCTHGVQLAVRLLWAFLLLAGLPALAQPVLVKDVHPEPPYPNRSAYVTLNGTVYFAADGGGTGTELYRSDPKVTTPTLVKDIIPGGVGSGPAELVRFKDGFLFTVADGLYRSDGTEAGTVPVKIFNTLRPYSLVNANGTAFFVQFFGSRMQIWKSDGTADGTVLLKELDAVYSPYLDYRLVVLNGSVFFVGYDTTHGVELWKSDGTAAGTVMIKDIYPGGPTIPDDYTGNSSEPGSLTVFKGVLYFSADDGVNGRELWKSNGTAAGTVMVKDLAAPGEEGGYGYEGSIPAQLTATDEALYFVTTPVWYGAEVYKTDGTAAGTVLLTKHYPPRPGPGSSVFGMTAVGNTVYYGESTSSPSFGTSVGLYKTDGTPGITDFVYDFSGGATESDGYVSERVLGNFTVINGALYFTANDGLTGTELWKSDGSGTAPLPEVQPGRAGSYPTNLVNLNGVLFFDAGSAPESTRQWKYDTSQPFSSPLRINAGGPGAILEEEPEYPNPIVPNLSYYFAPDAYFSGGNVTNPTAAGSVYDSRRWGAFNYNIPVADGTYRVVLHFNEPYWGAQVPGGVGSRKFNVDLEGSRKLTEYDIFAKAGGARRPIRETFTVDVTDGTLNIAFLKGSADNAILSALEVSPTIAVNRPPVVTSIPDRTVVLGDYLRFQAQASDPDGHNISFRLDGPANAIIDPGSGTIEYVPNQVGTFVMTVSARDNGYPVQTAEKQFTVTVVPDPDIYRVKAGGDGYSTPNGRRFAADAYFSGGSVSAATTRGIAGTADDYLYQTGRHGASFSYNIPTGNGAYDVVLHFAETYWGNTVPGGAGSRKFHVNLEGQRKLTDYDVFARAGGALRATQETFRVTVSDGTLNVAFLKGAADNPAVKAIEVLPADYALLINAGGPAVLEQTGNRFSPDGYYAGGHVTEINPAYEVENTGDDALYRDGRVGNAFSYGLPTGDGTFDVTLHFAETYWGVREDGGAGSRKFNVEVEGVRKLTDYDIFVKAGGALRAVRETMRVTVTDGVLDLDFSRGSTDLPLVSAIEVLPVTEAARMSAEDLAGQAPDAAVRMYPNPARDYLRVQLPFPAARVTGTTVVTPAGRELLRDGHRAKGEYELEIPVGHLVAGLYLLRLESAGNQRVLRFVKGK
jgi:ELWxxDGT repeat protein